jgi:hypothetical protein
MERFEEGEDEEAENEFGGQEESNIDINLHDGDYDYMEPHEKE